MAVERRPPGPTPRGSTPPPDHVWLMLIRLWDHVHAGHDGLPAPHVHLDGNGTVADPEAGGGGSDRMTAYFHMGA